MSDNAFVHVRDLRVVFRRDGQTINAVNGVSFEVQKGEVMALIGESGSGKSVTLRALMRLHPPGSSELSGTLQVGDDEVLTMSASQLRRYRGGRCAMIFQEPLLALLNILPVDTDAAASQLDSVEHHIIGLCPDSGRVRL